MVGGLPALRFKYIGIADKVEVTDYDKTLLIVLDTPNIKRVDYRRITKPYYDKNSIYNIIHSIYSICNI